MIGRRRPSTAAGSLAVVLTLLVFGARPADASAADPPTAARRMTALQAAAEEAVAELDRTLTVLATAVEDGRQGSARIVSGDDPPEPPLLAAAATLEGGQDELQAARAAIHRLAGRQQSVAPGADLPPFMPTAADLTGIAEQLTAAADVAGPFVERRHAATATLQALGVALAALDADDPAAAQAPLDDAAAAREVVAAWDEPPPALAVWLSTTGAMIEAAGDLASAALRGDQQAAEAAARAYADAAEQAGGADRALALSTAEAGSGLTLTPMQRLASITRALEELRASVSGLLAV